MDVTEKEYKKAMIEFIRYNTERALDNTNVFATMSAAHHERILFTARKLKELRCNN